MITFTEIDYVRLTTEQKNEIYPIIRKAAILLRKWAQFYHPKKFRKFRNDVMKGSKNPQGLIPNDRLAEFHADLKDILVFYTPMEILNNRTIEEAVLEGFAAMAKLHANQWLLEGDTRGVTRLDYLQECYMSILEVMYQYSEDTTDLSTYVWRSLRNRMINVTNQGNLLCPLTNSDLNLFVRYDRARRQNGEGTFDEIVESLGLTSEEGVYLGSILNQVYIENQLNNSQQDAKETGGDYTILRTGIDHDSLEVATVDQNEYVENILSKVEFEGIERELFEAAMNPFYGWQTKFSQTHENPATGKPYSKMRISQLLKSAQNKVAQVLNSEKEKSA